MPWKNDTGKWKDGGPWGQRPRRPGPPQPPDLEEFIRRGQDRLRSSLPSGGGSGGALVLAGAAAFIALWLFQCIYTVQPNERGQELVFGRPKAETAGPGLQFHFWPVETVEIISTAQQTARIGAPGQRQGATSTGSLMLSGDQNIVDVVFTVIWQVRDPKQYLFDVSEPDALMRRVAESAMREFVGQTRADEVRTGKRAEVEEGVRLQTQTTLDSYGAGIQIVGVQLERADPPQQVADAFEEVQRAQQNQEQLQREGEQYASRRLGEARGEASQIKEAALGYRDSSVAGATGEAQRFLSVLAEYEKAKDVTRQRLFLETMEKVLKDANKVIIEQGQNGAPGVVPYLPLGEIQRQGTPR